MQTYKAGGEMMKKNKLKPCPFCGGEVRIYTEAVDAVTDSYVFACCSCNSNTYFDFCDREEAIEAWNTRSEETINFLEVH